MVGRDGRGKPWASPAARPRSGWRGQGGTRGRGPGGDPRVAGSVLHPPFTCRPRLLLPPPSVDLLKGAESLSSVLCGPAVSLRDPRGWHGFSVPNLMRPLKPPQLVTTFRVPRKACRAPLRLSAGTVHQECSRDWSLDSCLLIVSKGIMS